jgi:trimethylamine--corrinoid protein Co-methyltransferase
MPYQGGQYKPLTESQIKTIHESALRVLERTGVKVNTKTGREHFKRAGANVDESTGIVRMPRTMVEDAIASAPHRLVLCGRDPKHDAILEGSNVYLGTGGTAINVLDMETGKRRQSTTEDVAMMALLTDALENVHVFTINVFPNDIKIVDEVDANRFYWSLRNTSKHVMGGIYTMKGLQEAIEMSTMLAGSLDALRERPFVSFITLVISPLKMDGLYGDMTCYLAELGLPVVVPTEPLCGVSSPITLASNVLMHVAESLAGVTLTQVINPGCPVMFGSVGSITDMRTMGHVSGAIERGIINAAVSQMAIYYRLPNYSTAGMTDAKSVDCQAGYESGMMNLLVAMSGANYIHDAAGLMEFDLTASYEKMVIDDEIIGRCLRVLRGVEVTEDTLAVDLIEQVGAGKDYLGEEHTLRYMRTEFASNTVSDLLPRECWEADGSLDTNQRAHAIALKLLAEHQPLGIPSDMDARIRARFPHIRAVATVGG